MLRASSRAAAAAAAAALALTLAGCGGGDDEGGAATSAPPPATTAPTAPATATATAPSGPVAVRVIDGDSGRPLAGAALRAAGGTGGPVELRSDAAGMAQVPGDARLVTATAPGHAPGRAAVRPEGATVRLYDPRLQSPEYGGGSSRGRFLPAVQVAPPGRDERPAWSFDGRTLIEFPPAVDRGLVVFGVNSGRIYALDAETGAVRWARRVRGEIASSPAISGDRVYVTSMDGMLTVYRRADGKRLWEFSTGGSPIESSPLVLDGLVYFGAWNGNLYAVSAGGPRERWRHDVGGEIKGSASLAPGGRILVGDYGGDVTALDHRTGDVLWSYTGGRRFYGGPAVSGTTAVIGDVGGSVIALDTRSGAERWRHSTGAYVYSTPAIARGTVFVGSYNGRFDALDLATGASRWSFDAGERISGSATVVGRVVYTSILYQRGEPPATYGLDVATGAVRYRGDDGRYSPAVGAGRTLYLVGSHTLYAYRATAP